MLTNAVEAEGSGSLGRPFGWTGARENCHNETHERPNDGTMDQEATMKIFSKTDGIRHAAAASAFLAVVGLAGSAMAADAPDAAKLWSKDCQTCHGPDGKGKTKAGE